MKKLKNEFLKKINTNFMAVLTSMVYALFKIKFVSSPLSCRVVTQTSIIRCLENSSCILMFILLVDTFIAVLFQ